MSSHINAEIYATQGHGILGDPVSPMQTVLAINSVSIKGIMVAIHSICTCRITIYN